MYKLSFFVPEECKEMVKNAVFAAGGGKIGNYDQCCFETKGRGQFRPLENSDPTLGEHNKLTFVDEVKVELVVSEEKIKEVLQALKNSHPYEEPAYDVFKCAEISF